MSQWSHRPPPAAGPAVNCSMWLAINCPAQDTCAFERSATEFFMSATEDLHDKHIREVETGETKSAWDCVQGRECWWNWFRTKNGRSKCGNIPRQTSSTSILGERQVTTWRHGTVSHARQGGEASTKNKCLTSASSRIFFAVWLCGSLPFSLGATPRAMNETKCRPVFRLTSLCKLLSAVTLQYTICFRRIH